MALHPLDFDLSGFADGEEAGDGETWTVLGEIFTSNPARRLGESEREMLSLWRHFRSSGLGGGPGHLPDEGGVLDQAAVTLDALEIMSAAEAAIRKERKGEE